MGFASNSALLERFHTLSPEEIDRQTLFLCESYNYTQNLDNVLQQYKYSLLNNKIAEQDIFRKYLRSMFPESMLCAMEGALDYER